MKCRKEQDTVKGDGEKEGEKKGEEEKIAREGSCKREEASGAARTLWEALVLGEKWNNTRPGLRLATTPCKKLHFGGGSSVLPGSGASAGPETKPTSPDCARLRPDLFAEDHSRWNGCLRSLNS